MNRLINAFVYAGRGLKTVWKEEQNFRIQGWVGLVVVLITWFYSFSSLEILFCVIAILMVLSAEIINTAIEDLCNKIEPNHDEIIGKVKDIMSAFVLVSAIGALLIGIIVFYHHFILI